MAENGMLSVFVSSTYRDLKEIRGLLIGRIEESLKAVAMEKFPPINRTSQGEAIKCLEESDICIFIIGDFSGELVEHCSMKDCTRCTEKISYTHCEYKRAVQTGKRRMVYLVHNRLSDVLSGVEEFDLKSVGQNEILEFLEKNKRDISDAQFFSGYMLEDVRELHKALLKSNVEELKSFKEELKETELCCIQEVREKDDYVKVYRRIMNDLKENILRWYKEGERGISFADFAGRRNELTEFSQKLNTMRSVCVVGTGGVGKTSLIQVGLLLERLQGREVYAFLKEYAYQYTRAGYPHARNRFIETTFRGHLTLVDILKKVFEEHTRRDDILKLSESEQCSELVKKLNRERSILFVDDLQDAAENVKQFVYASGNNLTEGAVVAGTRERGNCYSAVELMGLKGTDLEEMITGLAKTHAVPKDVGAWSQGIFRITQGHPMLVDIMVRNASYFADDEKLKQTRGIKGVADQKTVDEVMDRLIRAILTEEELRVIGMVSVFPFPVEEGFVEMIGGEGVVRSIVGKELLRWERGELVFTFEAVRVLLEAEAPAEYHGKAVEYYGKGLEGLNESEKMGRHVEIVYHLLRGGKDEEGSRLYFEIIGMLERVRRRAVEISEMVLSKTGEEDKRAPILGTLGNLLLKGREFARAGGYYEETLGVYRKLAERDPAAYESDVAMTLNNLGNLYNNLRDFKKAEECYAEALTHRDSLPDSGARIYLGLAALTEQTKNEDAYKIYFTAGVLSLNLLAIYGLPSIDFLYCFKKAQELSPPESPIHRMAAIATSSISTLMSPQSADDLTTLKTEDLPETCKALATLLTKNEVVPIKEPQNETELMFSFLYQEIRTRRTSEPPQQ